MKTKSLKSRKTVIFPRGLTHSFGPKFAIFPTVFLGNIGQENVFYDIVDRKNAFVTYKNKKSKKSKNWHFFKGVNPWFWSKNGRFSSFYVLGNIAQKNLFYDILEEKTSFWATKTRSSKSRKIDIFPKGLTHGFCAKIALFSNFFFSQYGPSKSLLRYSRTKKCLQSYKKKKFKQPKNWHFSKGVNLWFWSKNGKFSNFFF